jgi:hypothetical protein
MSMQVYFIFSYQKNSLFRSCIFAYILGLQSFPRECEDKDMAAMLDVIIKISNEKYFEKYFAHATEIHYSWYAW